MRPRGLVDETLRRQRKSEGPSAVNVGDVAGDCSARKPLEIGKNGMRTAAVKSLERKPLRIILADG